MAELSDGVVLEVHDLLHALNVRVQHLRRRLAGVVFARVAAPVSRHGVAARRRAWARLARASNEAAYMDFLSASAPATVGSAREMERYV